MCATPKGGQVAKALPAGAARGVRRCCLEVEKRQHTASMWMRSSCPLDLAMAMLQLHACSLVHAACFVSHKSWTLRALSRFAVRVYHSIGCLNKKRDG